MMKNTLLLLLCLTLAVACGQRQTAAVSDTEGGNAVYYWRTTLRLDSTERDFLHRFNINKVYCRYFDVVMDDDGEPVPNATIAFADTLPDAVALIPVVYITEDCMHRRHEGLAEKLVRRVRQMNETNDLGPLRELQIDCDYTARSRRIYYDFLAEVRHAVDSITEGQAAIGSPSVAGEARVVLSATIRLHQLSMETPPVDYGVLMLYNTGDPRLFDPRVTDVDSPQSRNPILDIRDVRPYLHSLAGYQLPLSAAYPVYRWIRHVGGVRIEHVVSTDEIIAVKRAVETERPQLRSNILTYHLDKENIERYKPDDYEAIYHH